MAQIACLLEVSAPKPGNVNRQNDFADTRFEDFLLSAVAIGPALEGVGRVGVGQTIWRAIRDTRLIVHTNTNLGIVLLLAPLVKASQTAHSGVKRGPYPIALHTERSAERQRHAMNYQNIVDACPAVGSESQTELREGLAKVLSTLTVEDARWAYAAIRLAKPGGLGRVARSDVNEEPSITLYEAMALAQQHDAIAREYITNFAITFMIGYPTLRDTWHATGDLSASIVQTYLTILAQVPDTLIARKRGNDMAIKVSEWAKEVVAAGGVFTAEGRSGLENLDRALRDEAHTLNPGTTADLTTAAIYLLLLLDR